MTRQPYLPFLSVFNSENTEQGQQDLQRLSHRARYREGEEKRWEDDISEWTGLGLSEALRKAEDREEWTKVVARSSLMLQRSVREPEE